jgi:undecaprenyl-phosphate galactose phosphotransferase
LASGATILIADCIAFVSAMAVAGIITWQSGVVAMLMGPPSSQASLRSAVLTGGLLAVAVMLSFARRAHYWRRVPFWSELRDVVTASLVALLCDGFVQYSLQRHDSRLFIGFTWVLFPAAVMLSRKVGRKLLALAGVWKLRAVVIGFDAMARRAKSALLSEPGLGYCIVGEISPTEPALRRGFGQWKRVMRQHGADLLVLALDTNDPGARELTESLVRERVPFAAMPEFGGLPVLGFEQTCFFSHDTVMFSYRNNLAQPVARLTKVVFDICAAFCMLVVLAPLLAAIAMAVKMDGGPVLFTHPRVGANGREFLCFKFRSMVTDGDKILRRLLETDGNAAAEWAATQKLRNDPRITWIGRLLRSTSLDELPQLLNVLRLEMSLVGPRPIVRSEVPRYAADITYYYETRPGLTGLWQVSGRSDTSYERRVQLDTWYVKNWTIWHDLAILAKTLPAVLKRRGAV